MSRGMKAVLCGVMLIAVLVLAVLGTDLRNDRRQITELQRLLRESRGRWESIAEEKEALQAELKKATEALREANLTVEESETRAEKLREEIEALKEQ